MFRDRENNEFLMKWMDATTISVTIGGFHSRLKHGESLVVNFAHIAILCLVGSEQMSLNCPYSQTNIRSIPMIHN